MAIYIFNLLYCFVRDFMNIDFNIVFSSLDFILSKYKGFSWNRTEGIFRHLFAKIVALDI